MSAAFMLSATHLVDEGVYLVQPVYGYGSEWEVDGLPVPTSQQFTVSDLSKVTRITRSRGPVVAFESEDGEQISPAAFNDKKTTLLIGATEEGGEFEFPSLDAEFEYRKFMARWKPVYGPEVVTREQATFKVAEVRRNSGDPDIVSLWNAPHVARDATLYCFNKLEFGKRLVAELAKEHGLTVDQPNHSGLRFTQLDGAYAFNDKFEYARGREMFIGTLEMCKADKAAVEAEIRAIVHTHAIKKSGKPLLGAGGVLLALESVQARLETVVPKGESSKAALSGARKRLRDLAAEIAKDPA